MTRIEGIATALITPFTEEGQIDREALKKHCNFLIEAGVNSLYILGTTGEVFLMNSRERKLVAELVVEYAAGRVPVFVQIGSMPTAEACELAVHAKEIGVAGVGAITPYYFKASQMEMKQYYLEIADVLGDNFPLYLYNLPACTGNDLLPETVAELAEVPNIVGIKNSMEDMRRLCRLIDETPADFDVIQGCDTLLMPGLIYGASGSVSGNSNVFPELFVGLYRAVQEKNYEKAKGLQLLINKVARILKNGAHLAYFKKALEYRNFKPSFTRKPLLDMTEQEAEILQREISHFIKYDLEPIADTLRE